MLQGHTVALRARHQSDVPVLHTELYNDVATRLRADNRPWRPLPIGSPASPYAIRDLGEDAACFSVVTLEKDELAGEALLWNIDNHNRSAHLGLALRPAFRGRGLGTDVVRVLCRYGFAVLGMQRLQLETLSDNHAMLRAAERTGFLREGTLRQASWTDGAFSDQILLGLLAGEWKP